MKDSALLIFVFGVLGFIYFKFFKTNTNNNTITSSVSINYNSPEGKLFNKFFDQLTSIISDYNLEISEAQILAVIEKESYLDSLSKANRYVLGDDNNSIGYMQVSRPAVVDVNNYYDKIFTVYDLLDENKNLLVGSLYLNICYLSALKQKSKNPVWLSFKKYNGGNDETDNSLNSLATSYANKAFDYYKKFVEFT